MKNYEYDIKNDSYKRYNNMMIEDEKEREYFKNHNCPNCKSRQIYYRTKTKDYKCRVCKGDFYFRNNMYKIINVNLTIDDLRVIKGWLIVNLNRTFNNKSLRELINKIGEIIKRGRRKMV